MIQSTKTKTTTSISTPSSTQASSHLDVLLNDRHVGIIEKTATGKQRLIYDAEWHASARAIPVSRSMPTTKVNHDTTTTTNFMWNLLPDNRATLDRWANEYKVSANNPYALLSAVGEDCPGAIQLIRPGTDIAAREGVSWITHDDLAERIKELKADPGAMRKAQDKGRASLAGAQAKTALYKTGDRWGVPNGRTPTTHILKPEPSHLPGFAANEHFALLLMRKVGLPTPDSEVMTLAGIPVFVTKRYDRFTSKSGSVRRIHQEDMCQALGLPPGKKFQEDGGPGIPEIMEVLRNSEDPFEDRDRFMRAQAMNFVLGNGDAHAKNYSIIYRPGGAFRLAPFYDVASMLIYAKNVGTMELAMTVGSHRGMMDVLPEHWMKTAKLVGFNEEIAVAHVRDLIARVPGMALAVRYECKDQRLDLKRVDEVVDAVWQRTRTLAPVYGSELMKLPSEE